MAEGIHTIHGRVDFLQLVGITQHELEMLREDSTQTNLLVENMEKDNPYLVTDMNRVQSYL